MNRKIIDVPEVDVDVLERVSPYILVSIAVNMSSVSVATQLSRNCIWIIAILAKEGNNSINEEYYLIIAIGLREDFNDPRNLMATISIRPALAR